MIKGIVSADLDATIKVTVSGSAAVRHRVEVVIDTGFNGFLMLPLRLLTSLRCARIGRTRAMLADGSERVFELYAATINWHGRPRAVEVDAADEGGLVGRVCWKATNWK
jgi:clan AA aspartic protease